MTENEGFRHLLFDAVRDLRREVLEKHSRHVSLGDLLFDRGDTAEFYGFGEGSTCYNNVLVIGDVRVGKNTWIGPNVVLDGSGGLSIGDNCAISAGVQIYSHHTLMRTLSGGNLEIERKPTTIGNNVYIGPNSVVQMGSVIGDEAVIGALTFVNKDVPARGKIFGSANGRSLDETSDR
jgi:acetyltransferase-like isoleucine patch superfamily enzyme